MKRNYIFLLLSEIVCFWVLFLCFPYTIQMQEGEDLFLLTREFLGGVISRPQGITFLISDFLEQFFATAWVGALIYSLVITLSQWLLFLTLRNLGKTSFGWLAFFPALLVVPNSFPFVDMSVNFLFFSLLLYVFTAIKSRIWRTVYTLLLPIPAFCLMPWYEAVILLVVFVILEYVYHKSKITSAVILVPLAFSFFVPRLWSDFVDFVPFNKRPLTGIDEFFTWKVFVGYVITCAAVLMPLKKKTAGWISCTASALCIAAFAAIMLTDKDLLFGERTNKLSLLADQKDWEGIIAEVPYDEAVKSKILTDYVLLAMSATDNLPQVLFSYPLSSPEDFLYRHDKRTFYTNFNRQFYDNIGIWDEAFHQAFEYGVTQRENECFRSLRFKIDYALNSCDLGVARSYLELLQKSVCNGDFVKGRMHRLVALEAKSNRIKLPPYRSDTFVGAYPMPSELFRLFERNVNSKKLLDYVLCSLLLNKEVEKFGIILSRFNLYKNSEMPRAYAEALTALASRDPRARSIAGYNPDLEKYFADFASKAKQNNGPGEYSNTYWAYLFFHQIEKPEEAAN